MNASDSVNPYEPSQHAAVLVDESLPNRRHAIRRVRIATACLFVPAVLNLGCLYWPRIRPSASANDVFRLMMGLEIVWMTAVALAIAFVGVRVVDWLAEMLRRLFGQHLSRGQWLESMYVSSWPLPWAAAIGAVAWCAWMGVFFGLPGGRNPAVTFAFGTIGHLLGASVYLNIVYGWYCLRRRQPGDRTQR